MPAGVGYKKPAAKMKKAASKSSGKGVIAMMLGKVMGKPAKAPRYK